MKQPGSGFGRLRKLAVVVALAVVPVTVAACGSDTGSSTQTTSPAAGLFAKGLAAEKAGNAKQASIYLNQVIQQNPTNQGQLTTYANYNLGVLAQVAGNTTSAIQYYNQALALSPTYRSALFNLAIALTPTDPHQAILYYDKILASTPNDANTLYNAGLLQYQVLGNQPLGRQMINQAISIVPSLASKVPAGVTLS